MAAINMPNQLPNRVFVDENKAGQQQQQPWIPDERDSFISWLRSEFAAANAIIDVMCQHLQVIASSPGEYDYVLNCLRQRRYNWTAVLHMQQYFSVEEVVMSLQQVALKKRQMHPIAGEGALWGKSEVNADKSSNNKSVERNAGPARSSMAKDEKRSTQQQPQSGESSLESSLELTAEEEDRASLVKVSKSFQSLENVDGRMLNVVEGLRIYENVFSSSEGDHLASILGDLQGVGRKVELGATGYKIVGGKRFAKAKSSEPNVDTASEDLQRSPSRDETTDTLPVTLQLIVDRLLECHILPASKRPDSYLINFLGEGGYLPPQTSNQEFEQPFCIIILQSDCSMVFGRFITMDSPRDFRSQFKITVSVGSVLVLQGHSAKFARYAVPAVPTKRCCLVLGKTLSKRNFSRNIGFQRSASSGGLINIRPGNNNNNNTNNLGAVQTLSPAGAMPSNQMLSPATSSSPMQPGFGNAAPPQQGGPFPPLPVMVPGWSPVPRPARLISGTGVFLPYNASSGPGRPGNANHRGKQGGAGGGPVLQKTNSLPASFRTTQNGGVSSSTGKSVEEESGSTSSSINTNNTNNININMNTDVGTTTSSSQQQQKKQEMVIADQTGIQNSSNGN